MGPICIGSSKGWGYFFTICGAMICENGIQKIVQCKPTILIKYALRLKKIVYQNENVFNGNIVGYINGFIWREKETNVHWDHVLLLPPWNPKVWGYATTIATKDIEEGDELFIYYLEN